MARADQYVGIDKEIHGGMTSLAKLIRDAWVFELIPESETCEGWNLAQMDALLDKTNARWDEHGCLVSLLPSGLATRHQRIHGAAFARARRAGWSGELETADEA